MYFYYTITSLAMLGTSGSNFTFLQILFIFLIHEFGMQGHQFVIFCHLIVNFILGNWLHEIWIYFHENVHLDLMYSCDLFQKFYGFPSVLVRSSVAWSLCTSNRKEEETKNLRIFRKLNFKNSLKIVQNSFLIKIWVQTAWN